MDLIKRYCTQGYVSYEQLKKEFEPTIADALWKEIVHYRTPFQWELEGFSKAYILFEFPYSARKIAIIME